MLSIAMAASLAGCASSGATPSAALSNSAQPEHLSINNGTSITVDLVVNGEVVEEVAPGAREDPLSVSLPPLPWLVETRSPSGRTLTLLRVSAGDVVYATGQVGPSMERGVAVAVDLSCGRLEVWSGPPLSESPTFIPGPSGDCD